MTIYHLYHFVIKGHHRKRKIIEHSIQHETQTRKRKLVNTTQDQPRNRPLARPGQKGTNSPACRSTWSTRARARHLVNGGGRDNRLTKLHDRFKLYSFINYYLCRGGYVFTGVCFSVCLFVSMITQK